MSATEPSWIPLVVVDGGGLLSGPSVTLNEEACSILAAESPVPSKLALVALDGAQVAGAVVGTEPPASSGSGKTVTAWLWTKPLRKLPPASPSPTIMAIEVSAALPELGTEATATMEKLLAHTLLASSVVVCPVGAGQELPTLARCVAGWAVIGRW